MVIPQGKGFPCSSKAGLPGLSALGPGPVCQLAVIVSAPCPEGSVLPERRGMVPSSGCGNPGACVDRPGTPLIVGRADAKFAARIAAPAFESGGGIDPQAVDGAACHGLPDSRGDLRGHGLADRGPVPDLSAIVVPPYPEASVGFQAEGVIAAGCHGGPGVDRVRGDDQNRNLAVRGRIVPQLSLGVISPCPQGVVVAQGDGVVGALGDCFPRALKDVDGFLPIHSGVVSHLSVIVVAPRPEAVVGLEGHSVDCARCDRFPCVFLPYF